MEDIFWITFLGDFPFKEQIVSFAEYLSKAGTTDFGVAKEKTKAEHTFRSPAALMKYHLSN